MTNMATASPTTLILRRTFAASRERVFDAWTDPNIACQFLCPDGVRAVIRMDVRAGGAYGIDMHLSDGTIMQAFGVFREVQRPERIVMTWNEEPSEGRAEEKTLLTLEFFDRTNGTELVLTHERFSGEHSRDGHAYGWGSILRKCERFLESGVAADVDLEDLTAHASVYLDASPERVFRALAHTENITGTDGLPSTVTYSVTPTESGTRVAIRHDRLPSEDACTAAGKAWEARLVELSRHIRSAQ